MLTEDIKKNSCQCLASKDFRRFLLNALLGQCCPLSNKN